MNVNNSDRAKQGKEGFALLQEVTKRLEEMVRKSIAKVTADWDRVEDEKGHSLYTLRISDGTHSAQTQFTLAQLKFTVYWEGWLFRIWDELLAKRSDAQGRKVQELIAQLDEE
jgi:hypothetical protein